MKFYPNWKTIKTGLVSLCLTMLGACSTAEPIKAAKPLPLLCPSAHLCQTPTLKIKTNGDLVLAVERLFNSLELCKLKEQALTACIDNYNQNITGTLQ